MSAAIIFVDFNEPVDAPQPAPPPLELPPPDPTAAIRQAAWTEGYLSGHAAARAEPMDAAPLAQLLTALHDLETELTAAVETAALTVAGAVIDTVIAAAHDEWPASLPRRVHALAQRLKPALTVAPEFRLRDPTGAEHRFPDLAALTQALEAGAPAEDITIAWHRGQATISRSMLLQDLRHAVVPLTEASNNEQPIRYLP